MATKAQLELFTKLASNEKNTRLMAAERLLDSISNEAELEYALNRLTKGISSGRESARLGFSVALTELLLREEKITAAQILDLIEKHNTPRGNLKGQEEREYFFGMLFGLQSVVLAKVLERKSCTYEDCKRVIDLLVQLSQKRNWLRETCFYVLCAIVEQVPNFDFGTKVVEAMNELLQNVNISKTPDGVALYLALQKLPSNFTTIPIPNAGWTPEHPLHKSNLATLSKVMRQSDTEEHAQTGVWSKKLHLAWTYILAVFDDTSAAPKDIASFDDLWKVVIDEGMFSLTSSLERKFWGFRITELAMNTANTDKINILFSKNFMRCFINHLSAEDRYLHRAAKRLATKIEKVVQKHPNLAFPIVSHLMGVNGSPNFDRLTNNKLVEHILPLADEDGMNSILDLLIGFIKEIPKDEEMDEKAFEIRCQRAADTVLGILRNNKSMKHPTWIKKVLHIFAVYGYFVTDGLKVSNESIHNMFIGRLMSALGYLSSLRTAKDQPDEITAVNWPSVVLTDLLSTEKTKKYDLFFKLDESLIEVKNNALGILHKIDKKLKKSKTDQQQLQAFSFLYSLVLLQVYAGDADSVSVLEDLDVCYQRVFSKSSKRHSHADEPTVPEILTEVMLSFLSRSSALLRKLVDLLFSSFAQDMNEKSIQLICDVLLSRESAKNTDGVFENVDEDQDEDDFEDEDQFSNESQDEQESDWEMVSADDASADEELEAKLDALMQEANAKANEDESSEEELMNDEEMLALDEKIADVFRERKKASNKNQRKQALETVQQMVVFKTKVLDLVDLYMKTQTTNPLCLQFLLPLTQMMQKTKFKVLEEKGQSILRNRLTRLHFENCKLDSNVLITLLEQIHNVCSKKASLAASASSISQLLMKLFADDATALERGIEVYADTFKKWIQNPQKNQLNASIFHEFVNWGVQQRTKAKQNSTKSTVSQEAPSKTEEQGH
ncbi:DNA polymerase phi [Schizosaccharomyces japonicus yFS275]|uniref:DNA polymerase phi n=1 Tax=Schizosaccharomyces japonicus (strain yFS275 / FY16936) TaxID=402676 RepID=B6JZM6_SCHJY|nr:DNA polymerase phi [Schizosaccharomyces japonicus yFS275]EEB06994.1 DNA polymerase phi [Schizosaccharomyces japonicus yFS275]